MRSGVQPAPQRGRPARGVHLRRRPRQHPDAVWSMPTVAVRTLRRGDAAGNRVGHQDDRRGDSRCVRPAHPRGVPQSRRTIMTNALEPFDVVDLSHTKRDVGSLNSAQINWLVDAYTRGYVAEEQMAAMAMAILSLIHISEPTRLGMISYAV